MSHEHTRQWGMWGFSRTESRCWSIVYDQQSKNVALGTWFINTAVRIKCFGSRRAPSLLLQAGFTENLLVPLASFSTTSLHDTTLVHICNRFTCPSSYSKGQEHRLVIPHADIRPNVVIYYYLLIIFWFQNELLGWVGHQDSVTPGWTSRIHVLLSLAGVLAVWVTGRKWDVQFIQSVFKDWQLSVKL